jgi:hypothetical protein
MKFNKLAAVIASFGILSSLSAANPIPMDITAGIDSPYLEQVPIVFNSISTSVYAGGIQGTLNGGLSQFFFCFDLNHDISVPGNYSVNFTSPSATLSPYLMLSSTFNLEVAASLVNNANIASFGNNYDKYVGLQLALWSVLYNWTSTNHPTNTLGTTSNPFSSTVTGDILTDALNFLTLANTFVVDNTYSTSYGDYGLLVVSTDAPGNVTQTLVGQLPTPEPTTYLMLGSFLLLGMLAYRRKQLATC